MAIVTPDRAADALNAIRAFADGGELGKQTRDRIATDALKGEDVAANAALARELLAEDLLAMAKDLLAEVARLEADGAAGEDDAEGMLWLDLALVRVLEILDPDEAAKARAARASSSPGHRRWPLWSDSDAPLGLVMLAGVAWRVRVHERWQRAVERPPALARVLVHDRLYPLMADDARVGDDGKLRDRRGEVVDWFNVAAVEPAIARRGFDPRRGVDVFGSIIGHRMIRFFALEAHARWVRGEHRPDHLHIDGGFAELARQLECAEHDSSPTMGALLDAGSCVRLELPGRTIGGLWTWDRQRAAPGRRAGLDIKLADVWLPGFAADLRATEGRGAVASERRRLVPVLRHETPHRMLTNRPEWGRACTVGAGLLVLLVDHADELARNGSVQIDEATFARLLDEAGLARGRLEVMRRGLLEGDGLSPALLERVRRDRYTLAKAHAAERAFIVDGGADREAKRNRARNRGRNQPPRNRHSTCRERRQPAQP